MRSSGRCRHGRGRGAVGGGAGRQGRTGPGEEVGGRERGGGGGSAEDQHQRRPGRDPVISDSATGGEDKRTLPREQELEAAGPERWSVQQGAFEGQERAAAKD